MYKNKKIFILGMARSGYEVAKLLSSDNEVVITDMKEQDNDKISELEIAKKQLQKLFFEVVFTIRLMVVN